MQGGPFDALLWLVVIVIVTILSVRHRRRRQRLGIGAAGSVYDWLNEEKRKAVEIIVEERAEARDPEDREGNLPELEDATGPTRRQGGAGKGVER
jgi:hypothetical protein